METTIVKNVIHGFKGTGFSSMKSTIDKLCGSNFFDQCAKKYDPQWEGYILPTAWYDMNLVMYIVEKFSTNTEMDFERCVFIIGKETIINDLNGVYKLFLNKDNPIKTLELFPLMGARYHNFLNIHIENNTTGSFIIKFTLPKIYKRWNIGVVHGRITGLLSLCNQNIFHYNNSVIDVDHNLVSITHSFQYSSKL